jgi:hypothetical protein
MKAPLKKKNLVDLIKNEETYDLFKIIFEWTAPPKQKGETK